MSKPPPLPHSHTITSTTCPCCFLCLMFEFRVSSFCLRLFHFVCLHIKICLTFLTFVSVPCLSLHVCPTRVLWYRMTYIQTKAYDLDFTPIWRSGKVMAKFCFRISEWTESFWHSGTQIHIIDGKVPEALLLIFFISYLYRFLKFI